MHHFPRKFCKIFGEGFALASFIFLFLYNIYNLEILPRNGAIPPGHMVHLLWSRGTFLAPWYAIQRLVPYTWITPTKATYSNEDKRITSLTWSGLCRHITTYVYRTLL